MADDTDDTDELRARRELRRATSFEVEDGLGGVGCPPSEGSTRSPPSYHSGRVRIIGAEPAGDSVREVTGPVAEEHPDLPHWNDAPTGEVAGDPRPHATARSTAVGAADLARGGRPTGRPTRRSSSPPCSSDDLPGAVGRAAWTSTEREAGGRRTPALALRVGRHARHPAGARPRARCPARRARRPPIARGPTRPGRAPPEVPAADARRCPTSTAGRGGAPAAPARPPAAAAAAAAASRLTPAGAARAQGPRCPARRRGRRPATCAPATSERRPGTGAAATCASPSARDCCWASSPSSASLGTVAPWSS